ncbi:MAG: NAD-dependent epimerase/dehydratase [Candidatus Gottesmanbacteria bacterium GW2011_GWB1_43_11]|uniref:NAD-dependent epimerase/dehydratase n=1 Tax=Candidatus Gottesmanbacteria bacterium GW2011_GWB1_43_11 TaxID=1618446 RepID=A0A0G1CPS2_9BACT|nr:MAG: NAD-dependent epimerase/dehydratase [Candidatus Gottesmanbacteria bacterium GW2011_GWA2_42_16]KKS56275.1 MAG: NAD-dependent epimerase/dehydratase [Candidatus Gottesmanbacteria bacterium GW2011_GWA1_42_26]KKS82283.1 MAG: NAD-dependent epimerase/dehydratase [Candidatus Gottesmanbacteria bacterium GW2011_GWC1_43_10]KKS87477.1 MAG: NAD-dependent epimerase/dehydratase [Candidatus Gottesmanbacteria bacterium GW2011_GWB1_43_11]OGG10148.1 MAG: hypothetical protein A2699_01215 [Candidatus Gottes
MKRKTIVITGAAGFIGSSLIKSLLKNKSEVFGIDNLTNNYDSAYKLANLKSLDQPNFHFYKLDILDKSGLTQFFTKTKPDAVVHLAALTGVRASLSQPELYYEVNTRGTKIVYENAVQARVKSFVFSSSSSIYGNQSQIPFSESLKPLPQSPYAKSKADAESLLKKLYLKHHLPTTVLRLFSVYGPHGRPDMAPYLFTQAAFTQTPISQYGDGASARDYTYIDDVVAAILKTLTANLQWEIINIGNSSPVKLSELLKLVEKLTNKKIQRHILPAQPAESNITFADTSKAKGLLRWESKIDFVIGMQKFVNWYKSVRLPQIRV